jgi:hypothetical protein
MARIVLVMEWPGCEIGCDVALPTLDGMLLRPMTPIVEALCVENVGRNGESLLLRQQKQSTTVSRNKLRDGTQGSDPVVSSKKVPKGYRHWLWWWSQ